MARRRTAEDCHRLAEERGFLWLGKEFKNVDTPSLWECLTCGHQWEARYDALRRSTIGCPQCARESAASKHRKRTEIDYRKLAKSRGFQWVDEALPRNVDTKTQWECQKGHRWDASFDKIRQGRGCPHCAGVIKKTPEDFHLLAEERGFRWVGEHEVNSQERTRWECQDGHRWQTTYSAIKSGKGCPHCAGVVRKTPDDYHQLATERGFIWLGPEVSNNQIKTNWRCQQNHEWEARYGDIQQGTGCPICGRENAATKRRKYGPADYHALAKERGYTWLGSPTSNTNKPTSWRCETCGYRWENSFQNLKRGSGCPNCAGKARKQPQDFHDLADRLGLEWIGPEVSNNETKTWWKCPEGHRWESTFGNMLSNRGCPVCKDMVNGALVSIPQRQLCEILGGNLNEPVGPYKVDIAIEREGIRIAVEYDSWYWHGGKEEEEALRDDTLFRSGWRLLHIRSNQLLPSKHQLEEAISCLLSGETTTEIVLEDWGKRPAKFGDRGFD